MADDFLYIPQAGGGESFRLQNWFRTITVGFQPYIPFTQAYRMALRNEVIMAAGKGTRGYMHYAPVDEPGEEEGGKLGKYPWDVRRKTFFGQGSGRLTGMSQKPFNRGEVALEMSGDLSGQAKEDVMGEQLSQALDSLGPMKNEYQALSSRAHQEIMLRTIEEMGEQLVGTSTRFTDRSSMGGGIKRGYTKDTNVDSFDVYLEETKSFGDFLEAKMVGDEDMLRSQNILSLEVSRAAAREGGSKLLTSMDTSDMTREEALGAWQLRLRQIVDEMNRSMETAYTNVAQNIKLARGPGAEIARLDAIRDTYHMPSTPLPEDYQSLMPIIDGTSVNAREWDKFMREMIFRLMEDLRLGEERSLENIKHLWSAPLTTTTVGLTIFYPEQSVDVLTKQRGAPQIAWSEDNTWTFDAIGGDIVMGYARWMADVGQLSPIQYANLTSRAAAEAATISASTLDRIERLGDYVNSRTAMDTIAGINLSVVMRHPTVPSMTHLRTTEIAKELAIQLEEYNKSGQMRDELRAWYEQLMEESERLTTAWMDMMPANTAASATLASEYVLGDNLGNPRKHYLGVWRDRLDKTWRGEEGSTGDVGYNFSIAPFITSRRAGTAQFN